MRLFWSFVDDVGVGVGVVWVGGIGWEERGLDLGERYVCMRVIGEGVMGGWIVVGEVAGEGSAAR